MTKISNLFKGTLAAGILAACSENSSTGPQDKEPVVKAPKCSELSYRYAQRAPRVQDCFDNNGVLKRSNKLLKSENGEFLEMDTTVSAVHPQLGYQMGLYSNSELVARFDFGKRLGERWGGENVTSSYNPEKCTLVEKFRKINDISVINFYILDTMKVSFKEYQKLENEVYPAIDQGTYEYEVHALDSLRSSGIVADITTSLVAFMNDSEGNPIATRMIGSLPASDSVAFESGEIAYNMLKGRYLKYSVCPTYVGTDVEMIANASFKEMPTGYGSLVRTVNVTGFIDYPHAELMPADFVPPMDTTDRDTTSVQDTVSIEIPETAKAVAQRKALSKALGR